LGSAAVRGENQEASQVPITTVVLSTSGFAMDEVTRAKCPWILVEPNERGGWKVTGPQELKEIVELFDPEHEGEKRDRIRDAVESRRAELLAGGISADKIAMETQLPRSLVEDELKCYANNAEGLMARHIDGNMILFRSGSIGAAASSGGFDMPFMQRIKALFSSKGENEKKIAFLSERRAALSVQRDRAFEEMGILETREAELRQQFKDTPSNITRRRLTSQLVQLRKDLERRQQLLGMLNQQMNVVSTHLHNLELVQQGQSASLPDSEELANDAAAAEAVLAELQADGELAGAIGVSSTSGMSEEEQALFEELEREAGGPTRAKSTINSPMKTPSEVRLDADEGNLPPMRQPERKRGEAEPG
jgi:hypothetical protein